MYFTLLVTLLLVFSKSFAYVPIDRNFLNEDLNTFLGVHQLGFNVERFLKNKGYPFENHMVTTEDGYNLALHRIPYGRNSSTTVYNDTTKPAVLIMHGLASSSAIFFGFGPEKSIALMLADAGYDVWLGNNRGNTYSRKHDTLNPDEDDEFWDFSFHELGVYDLPAMIDYIITTTGNAKISYVGQSQGTTDFFVLASEKPEYNDKINIMTALAPVVYCENLTNPLARVLSRFYTVVELVTDYLNVTTEFLGHSAVLETVLKQICKDGSEYQEVCPFALFLLVGFDSDQFDRSLLTTFIQFFPAGFSVKQLKHFLQLIESGHFRQYDYGVIKNLEKYDEVAPPDYNITRVTAPIALYYGKNDWLVGLQDVERLVHELPNVVENHLIEYDYFNHIDFLLGKDVVSMLYLDVVKKLNEVNGLEGYYSL